ncbi:hypothetical protein BBP40_007697 [Aspergillus hancockii]|nr:hypothetical protein BBP40_007697 [Aspergillus hancockii]
MRLSNALLPFGSLVCAAWWPVNFFANDGCVDPPDFTLNEAPPLNTCFNFPQPMQTFVGNVEEYTRLQIYYSAKFCAEDTDTFSHANYSITIDSEDCLPLDGNATTYAYITEGNDYL